MGYVVYPVHPTATKIEGLDCYPSILEVPGDVDRVSIYLPPHVAIEVLADVAAKSPKEVWLNPGSESEAVVRGAEELGLKVILACSIVDLGVTPAQFDS